MGGGRSEGKEITVRGMGVASWGMRGNSVGGAWLCPSLYK